VSAHQLCHRSYASTKTGAEKAGGQVQVIADWFSMVGGFSEGKVVPLNARTCASDAS